jgi:peroxiredoxin
MVFAQETSTKSIAVGDDAPTFALPDMEQNYISLRDFCGEKLRKPWINKEKHVVLLSFFATWCKPCMAEIPHLENIAQRYRDKNVKLFLIDVGEDQQKIAEFIAAKNISLPVLIDRYQTVAEKYDALTLPRLFIIDQEGTIRKENKGFTDPEKFTRELTEMIDDLLRSSS